VPRKGTVVVRIITFFGLPNQKTIKTFLKKKRIANGSKMIEFEPTGQENTLDCLTLGQTQLPVISC
jgi:hypothetical protein